MKLSWKIRLEWKCLPGRNALAYLARVNYAKSVMKRVPGLADEDPSCVSVETVNVKSDLVPRQ